MKLHRTIIENELCHGAPAHANQNMDLTLKEIIANGRISNAYETLVISRLAEFFKNGLKSVDIQMENPVNVGSSATSTEVINAINSLDPESQVELATYLLACIDAGECMLHNRDSNVVDWIKFVLRRQD